jgi:hypothetical protein
LFPLFTFTEFVGAAFQLRLKTIECGWYRGWKAAPTLIIYNIAEAQEILKEK